MDGITFGRTSLLCTLLLCFTFFSREFRYFQDEPVRTSRSKKQPVSVSSYVWLLGAVPSSLMSDLLDLRLFLLAARLTLCTVVTHGYKLDDRKRRLKVLGMPVPRITADTLTLSPRHVDKWLLFYAPKMPFPFPSHRSHQQSKQAEI
ncbi:hypothetical protein NQZ68_020959 [Dissostichus eleginoides]|nr:hypothetical protein NQZ68_020959 [Dissostichus eleginoides]